MWSNYNYVYCISGGKGSSYNWFEWFISVSFARQDMTILVVVNMVTAITSAHDYNRQYSNWPVYL